MVKLTMNKDKIWFVSSSIKRAYETKGTSVALDISSLTNLKVDPNRKFIRDTSSDTPVWDKKNQGYTVYLSNKISHNKRNLLHIPKGVKDYFGWETGQQAVIVSTDDKKIWTKRVEPVWDDMDANVVSRNLNKNNLIAPVPIKEREELRSINEKVKESISSVSSSQDS